MLDSKLAKRLQEMRETWQVRALVGTEGDLNAVIMSVLGHNYPGDGIEVMMMTAYPGFVPGQAEIKDAFFSSAAKVDKAGRVVADKMSRYGVATKDAVIFESEIEMRGTFRKLADLMKLNDSDRIEMFKCVQRWVVADRRLDPNFDPQDPDAKRLVH